MHPLNKYFAPCSQAAIDGCTAQMTNGVGLVKMLKYTLDSARAIPEPRNAYNRFFSMASELYHSQERVSEEDAAIINTITSCMYELDELCGKGGGAPLVALDADKVLFASYLDTRLRETPSRAAAYVMISFAELMYQFNGYAVGLTNHFQEFIAGLLATVPDKEHW